MYADYAPPDIIENINSSNISVLDILITVLMPMTMKMRIMNIAFKILRNRNT
jgi:hypothetical protein